MEDQRNPLVITHEALRLAARGAPTAHLVCAPVKCCVPRPGDLSRPVPSAIGTAVARQQWRGRACEQGSA